LLGRCGWRCFDGGHLDNLQPTGESWNPRVRFPRGSSFLHAERIILRQEASPTWRVLWA
jgi:hypothetical protein